MAVVFSADHEEGNLNDWPGFTTNTPSVLGAAAHTGSFGMRVDMLDDLVRSGDFTDRADLYAQVAIRVHVTTNPTSAATSSLFYWEDTGFASHGAVMLRIQTNGALALFLRNTGGLQVGSDFSITADTWYVVELHTVISGTVGVQEMRVDGIVRATGSNLNTGTVLIDRCTALASDVPNGIVGYVDMDDIIVDDAAYPFNPTPILTQTAYRWRANDGSLFAPP